MANDGVVFDRESASRIARAVPVVERMFPRGIGFGSLQYSDPTVWLPFRNDSGETCPGRSIVRITSVTTMSTELSGGIDDDELYIINKPNTDWHQCYAVTEAADIEDDAFGMLTFSPVALVAYDSGTPARGEGWGPKSGQWTVSKNYPATCIAQGIFDATNKYMRCNFGPIERVLGKTNASHAKGALGDVSVYYGTALSEADTTIDIEDVANKFADLDSGAWVHVSWFNGQPYLTAAECPA
jgi:hypothetical protein